MYVHIIRVYALRLYTFIVFVQNTYIKNRIRNQAKCVKQMCYIADGKETNNSFYFVLPA